MSTNNDPVWVANIDGASQTVFSGTTTALQTAADAAKRPGALTYERLDVAVASHCPIQEGPCRRVRRTGDAARRATARYRTNSRGRATTSAETVLDDLARAVAHPVQWYDATRLMGELGATVAIKTLPGHVLTSLLVGRTVGRGDVSGRRRLHSCCPPGRKHAAGSLISAWHGCRNEICSLVIYTAVRPPSTGSAAP